VHRRVRRTAAAEEPVEVAAATPQAAPQPGGAQAPVADPTPAPTPAAAPDEEPPPAPAGGIGRVTGRVTWKGDPPAPLPDLVMPEQKMVGCDQHGGVDATNRTLRVSADGGVQDVVVRLEPKSGDARPPIPAEPFVLDQLGCRFEPHVVVLPVGAVVRYKNSDVVNHNVNIKSRRNLPDNKTMGAGKFLDYTLSEEEEFPVTCDIHPWMSAQVVVSAAFTALTDADGNLAVEDLPAGTYRVSWWHEVLGKGKQGELTVADGETAEIAFQVSDSGGGGRRR
jgi:plastocyanin